MTDQGEAIKAWPPHPELGQLSNTIPTPELHVGRAAGFTETALQPNSPSVQTHVLPIHPKGAALQEHNVTRCSHASLPLPENPLPGETPPAPRPKSATVTVRNGAASQPLTRLGVAEHGGTAAGGGAAAEVAAAAAAHAAPPHGRHDLDLLAGADCGPRTHSVTDGDGLGSPEHARRLSAARYGEAGHVRWNKALWPWHRKSKGLSGSSAPDRIAQPGAIPFGFLNVQFPQL